MKSLKSLGGSNETGTILLLLIISVWFFTSSRYTALKKVVTSKYEEVSILDQVVDALEDVIPSFGGADEGADKIPNPLFPSTKMPSTSEA